MNPRSPAPAAPSLLVVDDSPANLQLLARMLKEQGFEVRPVPSGELALQTARHQPPDLILLDINMPGMNGYEVCQRLKADPALRAIPVIFLSALNDAIDKVQAFGAGGVDYVAKPFQFEEVVARVRTHLALRRQERQLEQNLAQLQELERLRDNLIHLIVHDMRSPLSGMMTCLSLVRATPPPDPATVAHLLQTTEQAAAGLNEMITQLLDISRLEAGQMPLHKATHDLHQTLRAASIALAAQQRVQLPTFQPCLANYDADLVGRVVTNLLANALKFAPADGTVRLTLGLEDGQVRVALTDTGRGIAPEYHLRIFEKFGQAELRDKHVGTGLGLAFCKLAVEAHGGQIGVASQPGQGSTFWFTLPLGMTS